MEAVGKIVQRDINISYQLQHALKKINVISIMTEIV